MELASAIAQRGITNGSGQANIDLAISKTTPLGWLSDSSSVQFRTEMYNALNHPQFADPDNDFACERYGNPHLVDGGMPRDSYSMGQHKEEDLARWRGLVSEQASSGKSVAAFCGERGLRDWQLYE